MPSLSATLKELADLGLGRAVYRLAYEGLNRSGLRRALQPIRDCRATPEPDYLGQQRIDLSWFRRHEAPFFVAGTSGLAASLRAILRAEQVARLLEEAEGALAGRIRCFSSWYADYGQPVDWHRNPRRGVSWPRHVHWSRAPAFEPRGGDCKLVWELNRFPHLYAWVRAYVLTGDNRWVRAFCDQLASWEEANPYRAGVNWNSGQELAIRAMAWVLALYVFMHDVAFTEEDFSRLMRLLYLHGEHLLANINFARLAVHNNHLIGEALGLYILGSYFPWMKGAARWKRVGRRLLEGECLGQFYQDGGYCQSSHNYHRLALHYYLWACRLGECLGEPFPQRVYDTLARSGEYLASFMNAEDGRLPNWGANDGALLCPWTECDYSDFRPVLNSLRYLTTGKRAFAAGPWDEELLWLWGPEALEAEVEPYPLPAQAAFQASGLYVHREGPGDFAVFRCGSLRDRFGQADQLHVDLWWRGLNVAQDGGSYLYNDELEYHRHFMGSSSHNTVTVDGQDQMRLIRRFKWLELVLAKAYGPWWEEGAWLVAGEHYGYRRLRGGVVHHRKLAALGNGVYVVVDRLQGGRENHRYRLHWLLGDWPYSTAAEGDWWSVRLVTGRGDYRLAVSALGPGYQPLTIDFTVARGQEGPHPRGWASRYYGLRVPALSVAAILESKENVLFLSVLAPAEAAALARLAGDRLAVEAFGRRYTVALTDEVNGLPANKVEGYPDLWPGSGGLTITP